MNWVIKNEQGRYLMVDDTGAFTWTADATWALQFARAQDAQMLTKADSHVGEIGLWRSVEESA